MGFIVKTIHVILDPNAIHVLFTTTMLACVCVCVFFPGQLSGIPDHYSLIQFTSSLFFHVFFFGFCNMNRINIHFIVYLANGTCCNVDCYVRH